ncbi:MAG: hypothetical protein ABIO04_07700 [Ferruginibacter sp.]
MKAQNKIILGVAAAALTGVIIYVIRRKNTYHILSTVANEGYETAQDILFPSKGKRDRKLQYGPVIPD